MAITRTPIIDDDGSGTTGTPLDNVWKQELYNQIDAADAAGAAAIGGTWINIPYAAGNFTAGGSMIWTVDAADQATLAYTILGGHTCFIMLSLNNSTLAGTAHTDCYIALPVTPTLLSVGVGRYFPAGAAWAPLLMYTIGGQPRLYLTPLAAGTFTLGTNNVVHQGTMITQV